MARMTQGNVELTAGAWAGAVLHPEYLTPAGVKLDKTQFFASDSALVTVQANAAQNATSISVKTTKAVPNGTTLHFGGNKFAVVNQSGGIPYNASAQSVDVLAIPNAVVVGDVARYAGSGTKFKSVNSGIFMGRTYAERDAATGFGPWSPGDNQVGLLAFEIPDLELIDDATLLLPSKHFTIYENFLPDFDTSLNVGVNEVQSVAIAGTMSGGQVGIVNDDTGTTSVVAYNGNLAAVQAAYDAVYGASKVVVAGTLASHTVTFSGSGVAGVVQNRVRIDISGATGATGATVTRSISGGKTALEEIRRLWNCTKAEA